MLLDQDGLPVSRQARKYYFDTLKKPGTKLSVFQGFRGYVSRFVLQPNQTPLPARNQLFVRDAAVDVDFADLSFGRSGAKNKGQAKKDLMFSELVDRNTVLYQVYEYT